MFTKENETNLSTAFADAHGAPASLTASERDKRELEIVKRREAREKRRLDKADDDREQLAGDLRAATERIIERQRVEFERRMQAQSAAITEALIDNEEALRLIRNELQSVRSRAVVLADGRLAYLDTETGGFVDETGSSLSEEAFEGAIFPENGPIATYQELASLLQEEARLEAERAELLDIQKDHDALVQKADDPDLSPKQLEELHQEAAELDARLDDLSEPEAYETARTLTPNEIRPVFAPS